MYTCADRGNAAADFLLFAAIGLTLKDFEGSDAYDRIVDASVSKAYTDASRRVLSVEDEEKKQQCKNKASGEIKSALEKLADSGRIDFDSWHKGLCEELGKIYSSTPCKDGKGFTVGIAQKWVNMTIKYLLIVNDYLLNEGYEFEVLDNKVLKKLRYDCRHEIHVPLDRYILGAIRRPKNEPLDPGDGDSAMGLGIPYKDFDVPDSWSKINNYDSYLGLQKTIRDLFPIEDGAIGADAYSASDWEADAWVAMSRNL